MARSDLTLRWHTFTSMVQARARMRAQPCVYVQADPMKRPQRVGCAPHGLAGQFRGVLAEVYDAAMHRSGNIIFVALVKGPSCRAIERELLWRLRDLNLYNVSRPARPPTARIRLRHRGVSPELPKNVKEILPNRHASM